MEHIAPGSAITPFDLYHIGVFDTFCATALEGKVERLDDYSFGIGSVFEQLKDISDKLSTSSEISDSGIIYG